MSSLRGRKRRTVVVVLSLSFLVTWALATPAWAHVTVHPPTLPAGSRDIELTFRVPNERDNASTVKAQVFFPTALPLLTVDVLPIPGWASVVHTQTLAKPIQTDDGPVSQIVTDVTWTATGGGIAPGQYEDFVVAAGSVPSHASQLVFKALQTYSSGEIVRWIQLATSQNPSPDHPAPVLTLTSGGTGSSPTPGSSSSTTADVVAIVALVLSFGATTIAVLTARNRHKAAARQPSASIP
jgi:periplasmic copper chaperone A